MEPNQYLAFMVMPLSMSYMTQIANVLIALCVMIGFQGPSTPYTNAFFVATIAAVLATAAALFLPGLLDYGTVKKDLLHLWGTYFVTHGITRVIYARKTLQREKQKGIK